MAVWPLLMRRLMAKNEDWAPTVLRAGFNTSTGTHMEFTFYQNYDNFNESAAAQIFRENVRSEFTWVQPVLTAAIGAGCCGTIAGLPVGGGAGGPQSCAALTGSSIYSCRWTCDDVPESTGLYPWALSGGHDRMVMFILSTAKTNSKRHVLRDFYRQHPDRDIDIVSISPVAGLWWRSGARSVGTSKLR